MRFVTLIAVLFLCLLADAGLHVGPLPCPDPYCPPVNGK
jgi:hypothetical protein